MMKYQDRSSEYLSTRAEGELNLLEKVKELLASSALHNTAMMLESYFSQEDLLDKKANVQRFYMNKFFQTVLLAIPHDSMDQRFCLITDGTPDDWLYLFQKKILPYLREHLHA